MNPVVWMAVGFACFLLPSAARLGSAGRRVLRRDLSRRLPAADDTLPDDQAAAILARARRCDRLTLVGGVVALLAAGAAALWIPRADLWGVLVVPLTGAGAVVGHAWALIASRPTRARGQGGDQPTPRITLLSDHLSRGRLLWLWVQPLLLLGATGIGAVLLGQISPQQRGAAVYLCAMVAGLGMLGWGAAMLAIGLTLAAPIRRSGDAELALDDAERGLALDRILRGLTVLTLVALALLVLLTVQGLTP